MDEGRIFIANLSKGKIGEENSGLLGSFLVAQFQLAAMQRADTEEGKRRDFYLYIDELQDFTTDSFRSILSEARKYRLCLALGHQYISQLPESLRSAVFGNVGTMIALRVGYEDAEGRGRSSRGTGGVLPGGVPVSAGGRCWLQVVPL
jgi:hypothetical protein